MVHPGALAQRIRLEIKELEQTFAISVAYTPPI
jgi:hypothetical protein